MSKLYRTIYFFGIIYFFLAGPGFAETRAEEPVTIKSELSNAFITIGDPVDYVVTLRHDPDVQILSPVEAPPQDILKIKNIEEINRKDGKKKITGRKFTLTAYRLGEFVLDPIQVQYRKGEGTVQTITTRPLYLTVKSVAAGEEKVDIRGVKSVLPLAGALWPWVLVLILSAGILAGFIAYQMTRKKKAGPEEIKTKLSAEDETLILLSQLFDSDLLRRGKIKEYHLRLSEILRIYFEKRFMVAAIELTTYELSRALRNADVTPELREKILEVLEYADLVKFAKWLPPPPKIKEMYDKSRMIVEQAKVKLSEPSNAL